MDADQKMNEEIVCEFKTLDSTKVFVSESEKHKMFFCFGSKNDGFMCINRQEEDSIAFDVYPANLKTEQMPIDSYHEEIFVEKEIVEKEITDFLIKDLTSDDIKNYLFDADTGEFYINIFPNMQNTYSKIKEEIQKRFLNNKEFPFISNMLIEGIGCLYCNNKPIRLIESIYFCSFSQSSKKDYNRYFSIYSLNPVSDECKEYSLVFFPYGKKYGYLIDCNRQNKDIPNFIDVPFYRSDFSTYFGIKIVEKKDYPDFTERINKINTKNNMDLYMVDPYEQRNKLFQKLLNKYEESLEVEEFNE